MMIPQDAPGESSPPLFRSWHAWYTLVLVVLAALIILFALFGRAYS